MKDHRSKASRTAARSAAAARARSYSDRRANLQMWWFWIGRDKKKASA